MKSPKASLQDDRNEAAVDALRDALIEGEISGPSSSFDFNAFIAARRASPEAS
ncbi:MAG: hypothetical protein C0481_20925 [Phenylobacterium sp.]|uniref:type II toxin-antitoxin system ParD family antitoxin n=1 Tax=Phenylobacterium sp. TaxID=1871053 RepID=UPI0025F7356E|nr:type II toxin-antitoxin system ParD family antitoxin [Phenylobacterium sp.]MBA4014331.1 hypothetical protein [Phenylobacterium sp.]